MHDDKIIKIKFYFRGLATGIVLTVVILGLTFGRSPKADGNSGQGKGEGKTASSSEPIESSETIESSESFESTEPSESLEPTESSESLEPADETGNTEESMESSENGEVVESSEALDPTEPPESSDPLESTEPTESSALPAEEDSEEYVTIVIQKGNSSWTVAKLLAEKGLVENAKAYDEYLCRNGYDKKISVGTFEIKKGSSLEEIAVIITSGNR